MFRRILRKLAGGSAPKKKEWPGFVSIAPGASVDHTVKFTPHKDERVTIGEKTTIWRNGELTPPIRIGTGVFINRDAYIRPQVTIGNNVSIGPFTKLLTDSHELSNVGKRAGKSIYTPIVIEDGVWIGAAAIILGGVTLGRGCVVAAGAVVTKNVDPDTLVAGVPAKVIRKLEVLRDA